MFCTKMLQTALLGALIGLPACAQSPQVGDGRQAVMWGTYNALQLSRARAPGPAVQIDPSLAQANARARDESLMRGHAQLVARTDAGELIASQLAQEAPPAR